MERHDLRPEGRPAFVRTIKNVAVLINYRIRAKARGLEPWRGGFRYLDGQACRKAVATDADTGQAVRELRTKPPTGGGILAAAWGLAFPGDGKCNRITYVSDNAE